MSEPADTKSIQGRSFNFAVRILRVVRACREYAGVVVGRQLARSGTGGRQNAEEARVAHPRPTLPIA